MMQWLLLVHALFVVSVPAIVVAVVSASAGRAVPPYSGLRARERRLRLATALFAVGVGAWILAGPAAFDRHAAPSPALGLVESVAFSVLALGFALPALREAGEAAGSLLRDEGGDRPRASVRSASLRRRRVSDYLPRYAQLIPFVLVLVGLVLLAARVLQPAAGERRLFLPLGFAFAGAAFAALHAAWMRDEAALPRPDDGGEDASVDDRGRGAAVRRIFAQQVGLAGFFPALALVVLDVDWASPFGPRLAVAAGLAGGVVGVLGCASVLASSVSRARLAAGARETWR